MNPRLAAEFLAQLPQRPRIVDIQSSGAMLAALAPRIGRSQVWTLLHTDADALEILLDEIAAWAERRGLTVTVPGSALLIHAPGGAWRVEALQAEMDDPDLLDLPRHDAVVCAGLLNRVDRLWLESFADMLDAPFLATAIPRGVPQFLPRDATDGALAVARHRAGTAMLFGAAPVQNPATALRAALAARGWTLTRGAADEIVPRHALVRLRALIEAQRDDATDFAPRRAAIFEAWHKRRLRQALAGRLTARVFREDLLAVPPARAPQGSTRRA